MWGDIVIIFLYFVRLSFNSLGILGQNKAFNLISVFKTKLT
ncbi:hypothetical protein PEPS_12410 [Persicobacter psychrovividus]|uniref:Uncharacterized protein n=1 Tax=Persicobacter psychrovividus TaxID=387638 RepID=A0ABM7VDD4_9BACT|nr:hypothetical protein PEPS_12410 [Persicobacter psychrovividus]